MMNFLRRPLGPGGAALVFATGLGTAGLLHFPHDGEAQQRRQQPVVTVAAPTPPANANVAALQNLSEAFATVAEQVKPSVVFIKSGHATRGDVDSGGPQMQVPPGFEQFFPNMPRQRRPDFQQSAGSGFVVSKDGYILTNNHVVEGSDVVTVRLLDRREFKAKVVGTDPNTDLAVLKIDARNLTPAPLGNSDRSRVGEWVLAVGNPLGENLTFTVTQGIISAKGRSLALPNTSDRSIQDFIQTDAAINPGNSGGPLVSVQGAVIGVNSAIASQSGFNAGYGFAIPINLARQVMDQIISHGRVQRAVLGVTVRNATPNDAAYVGLPDVNGVVVQDYGSEDSPARAAGIQPGDIIVSVDGKRVEYVGQLQQAIAFRRPGESARIEVARKGGVHKMLSVRLQELPAQVKTAAVTDSGSGNGGRAAPATSVDLLGLTVQALGRDDIAQLQLAPDRQGVIVTGVTAGGPAYGELVPPDQGGPDIILSVENKPVKSPADLNRALTGMKAGDIVSLSVYNAQAKIRRIERIRLGAP
ncbi:MAG: Do family serine endopeptidase [Gemmatimonadales bacterium]|nr:Do family serine endopeptidase [Gemmatimonadales bacterium]